MMKRQQFGRHMHLFGCMSFSSGSCCFRLHMLLRNVCPCELIALLMLICFALPTLAASTNVPPLSTTQVVTNRDAPSNDGWVAPDFTKDPKSTVKGLFREATSDSSAFFAFLAIVIPILYSILGVSLKVLFNKNLFAPFLWIVYLFSYRMRLRRFLKLFKGREVKCNPYVSIDRACLCDVRRIVENGRIRSGVFFFYGQCDVGKKVALVGELHCKGMAVVQISEDKWFNSPETRVRCEELVTALECVFPPFRRKLHLVLVLDSQIKDHNGYRQILEQTLNLLYNQLSDGVRKRVSVVVKMVGMYAARDIPDIHPIMIEPLSSKECVAFSNDYCKKMAYPSKDETMDEHILYVNSMGHPSRLIKYLEGNSSDGPLDIKALQNWTECVVASIQKGLTLLPNAIWTKITPCMENGKSAVVETGDVGLLYGSTEFMVFRPRSNEIISRYLHSLLRLKWLRDVAAHHFSGSAGHQRVATRFFNNLMIPVPPCKIQEKLVAKVNAIYEKQKASNPPLRKP